MVSWRRGVAIRKEKGIVEEPVGFASKMTSHKGKKDALGSPKSGGALRLKGKGSNEHIKQWVAKTPPLPRKHSQGK